MKMKYRWSYYTNDWHLVTWYGTYLIRWDYWYSKARKAAMTKSQIIGQYL